MLNDLMLLTPQTATHPVLLCYISTSLGPLIRSCGSSARTFFIIWLIYGAESLCPRDTWISSGARKGLYSWFGELLSLVREGLTSTVQLIMRRRFDSRCTDQRSAACYDMMPKSNVNGYLIYGILHRGAAEKGCSQHNEVLWCWVECVFTFIIRHAVERYFYPYKELIQGNLLAVVLGNF